jgi:hypothetical protein
MNHTYLQTCHTRFIETQTQQSYTKEEGDVLTQERVHGNLQHDIYVLSPKLSVRYSLMFVLYILHMSYKCINLFSKPKTKKLCDLDVRIEMEIWNQILG